MKNIFLTTCLAFSFALPVTVFANENKIIEVKITEESFVPSSMIKGEITAKLSFLRKFNCPIAHFGFFRNAKNVILGRIIEANSKVYFPVVIGPRAVIKNTFLSG